MPSKMLKVICGLAFFTSAAAQADYQIESRLKLGGDGKWDYPSVDAATHRLYLSRATRVAVIDTQTGKAVGEVANTPGVHGIAIAPEIGHGFISMGRVNQVRVFDTKTLATLADIDVGDKPDAILYEPKSHHIFAFNGHGDTASVIDPATNKVVATIALGGDPEFAQADGYGNVFVNLENRNELAQIETMSNKLINHWGLPGCDGPTGLALDAAHHRSFSVCANSKMTILDTSSGRALNTLAIGAHVDGAAFDVSSQNAFSANGDGTLTVVHEIDPEHFAVSQTLKTSRGARTIALDEQTHKLYLPTALFSEGAGGAAQARDLPMQPDSFFVLVVRPQPAG